MLAPEGGGKAPLDDTIALLGEVQVMLNAADAAIKGGGAAPPSPVPLKLKTDAQRTARAGALDDGHARRQQRAHLAADGAPEPERRGALAGRRVLPAGDRRQVPDRPQRDARRDARPTSRTVFAPGRQASTSCSSSKLAPYVDTTKRPWHFRPVDGGAPLGTDIGTLMQFQRAQAIRETFFQGGDAPKLTLTIKPIEMDRSLKNDHHRHRRPDRPLRPRPADPDADRLAGPARHDAGARPGRPAGIGDDLRIALRRPVGAAAAVRPRQLRADRQFADAPFAPRSTSAAARPSSRSRRAACAIRSSCPSCTTSSARWACDARAATASDEPDHCRRRHQRGRRPGTASSRRSATSRSAGCRPSRSRAFDTLAVDGDARRPRAARRALARRLPDRAGAALRLGAGRRSTRAGGSAC